jgi:hypothetical protein
VLRPVTSSGSMKLILQPYPCPRQVLFSLHVRVNCTRTQDNSRISLDSQPVSHYFSLYEPPNRAMRTYLVAPNFDIPPPPNGPIKLGQIISAPDQPTLEPINIRDHLPAPGVFAPTIKKGFSSTSTRLLGGELGLWAQVAASIGLKFNLSFDSSADNMITVEELETHCFNPPQEYVESVIGLPEVQEYVTTSEFKVPIYMITGLKVARGASMCGGTKRSSKGTTAIDALGELARVGPGARLQHATIDRESFEGSTDFVLAFRVQRIRFKRVEGAFQIRDAKTYTRGAKMLGDTVSVAAVSHQFSDLEEDVLVSSRLDKDADRYSDDWKLVESELGNVDDDGVLCNALYLSQE